MTKEQVTKALNNSVKYDGHVYKAIRYEAWKDDNGKLHHSLVLFDGRHTTMTAPIERIELIEDDIQTEA
jgi:hypothetical protein